jgi:SAM-dependent methyltransferase
VSENKSPEEILDATCGGRTIWTEGNKHHENALYIDTREEPPGFHGQEGRTYAVQPDEQQDFRNLPYDDESFNLAVFDPPHIIREGGMKTLGGHVRKKYGQLRAETWQEDLKAGFDELWRVLKPGGTLTFKFADDSADWDEVLELAPQDPLYGTTYNQSNGVETRWFVFYKPERGDTDE